MNTFQVGDRVQTLYEKSELATVIMPRHKELPLLPGWYVVRYDYDGRRGTIHGDMLMLIKQEGPKI